MYLIIIFHIMINLNHMGYMVPFLTMSSILIDMSFTNLIFMPSFYSISTAFFSFLFSILGSINSILSLFYIFSSNSWVLLINGVLLYHLLYALYNWLFLYFLCLLYVIS